MTKTNKERIGDLETDVKTLQQNSTPKWAVILSVCFSIVSLLIAGVSAYSAWSIDQKTPDLFESELSFLSENRTIETVNESYFNVSFLINNSGMKAGQDVYAQFMINESYSIVDYGYSFERDYIFNQYKNKSSSENSIIFQFDSIARNNVSLYILLESNDGLIPSLLDDIFDSGVLWESNIIQSYLIEKNDV